MVGGEYSTGLGQIRMTGGVAPGQLVPICDVSAGGRAVHGVAWVVS